MPLPLQGVPIKTLWLTATLADALTACSTPATPPATQTLKKPALDRIAAAPAAATSADFRQFLALAAQMQPQLQTAVSAYLAHKPLAGDDLVNISRLPGLHNRLRNQAAVIDATAKMVAIPTVRADKVPPHEDKHIIAFGALVEGMAKEFGLRYRNVDNRIFEVKLPGSGPEEFGILTHADVVPVVADEWVLDDGTRLDPFKLTRVGGNLYGRGSIDDKGSIATVLFAMKAVKDNRLPLARTIRLMIETTEETGGDAMKYYRAKTALPEYNIVLDSKYPAVVAEKGSGALRASFPLPPAAIPELRPSARWRVLHRRTPCPRRPPPACRAATWPTWLRGSMRRRAPLSPSTSRKAAHSASTWRRTAVRWW